LNDPTGRPARWRSARTPIMATVKSHAWKWSGGDPRLILARLAQYIAAPPHGLNVVLAVRGVGKLLAQLADKNVDDFDLRLVHAAASLSSATWSWRI
jgi:hypothetical protein